MTKWIVFAVYWLSLVITMRQSALWTWWFLIPTFVLLYTWAEEPELQLGPAADHAHAHAKEVEIGQ